jgi:hypothetical protein
MKKIIDALLAIEDKARESLGIACEDSTEGDIQTEIERNITVLERDADERIAKMEQASQLETEARVMHIKKEYQRKINELEASFIINRDAWLAEIEQGVLYAH